MASYNVKYNRDDSVIRHIIIGLLADLNNKVWIKRQIDKETRAIVDIPFYYSVTGDDEFLRDKFLFAIPTGVGCTPDPAYADGNYDAVPRGIVNLNSFTVDSGKLVNKRTRGEYGKLDSELSRTIRLGEKNKSDSCGLFISIPIDLFCSYKISPSLV